MSGLPNLARLVGQATALHQMYDIGPDGLIPDGMGHKHPAEKMRLAASAPDLAALLIECADALQDVVSFYAPPVKRDDEISPQLIHARAALSRLAGFDAQLGDRQ